jgi:phenylacetate-CoA ligase
MQDPLMEAHRMGLLRRQVAYAMKNSAFYREHLRGVRPASLRSRADLAALPLLRREDLAEHVRDIGCVPRSAQADAFRTSGSSGRPLFIPVTLEDLRRSTKSLARTFAALGMGAQDTVMLAVPLGDLNCPALLLEQTFRDRLGCLLLRIGVVPVERHLSYMREFFPSTFFGAPTPALRLGEYLREQGIDARELGMRRLILTGQPIYHQRWEPNALHRRLTELWRVEIFSCYGASEFCGGFAECLAHQGHHVPLQDMLFETVDADSGLPTPEAGELVFTSLARRAFPLIRYRSGDVSRIERAPCPCGNPAPRVMALVGRTDRQLKIKGTRLHFEEVEEVVLSVPEVRSHLIEVYRDEHDQDLLRVHVHLDGGASSEAALAEIRRRVREHVGVTPAAAVAPQQEIEQAWFAHGGGKPLKFRDLRPR